MTYLMTSRRNKVSAGGRSGSAEVTSLSFLLLPAGASSWVVLGNAERTPHSQQMSIDRARRARACVHQAMSAFSRQKHLYLDPVTHTIPAGLTLVVRTVQHLCGLVIDTL